MEVQIEADSVGHDLAFGWSHFNRGMHTPARVMRELENGEAIRHDLAPDLPDDEAQFPEDQFGDESGDQGADDAGPDGAGDSSPAREDQAFGPLTGNFDQRAEAAAPF
jgi:hypothetical protein